MKKLKWLPKTIMKCRIYSTGHWKGEAIGERPPYMYIGAILNFSLNINLYICKVKYHDAERKTAFRERTILVEL